jgi:hypothetical protein
MINTKGQLYVNGVKVYPATKAELISIDDISNFYNSTNIEDVLKEIQNKIDLKLDINSGKQLSAENFTTDYKNDLDNMQSTIDGKINVAITNLIDSSPVALNTLNELATALGDDPNFATTMSTQLGLKAPLASPALTGVPTSTTPATNDNTTKIATTAFVNNLLKAVSSNIVLTDGGLSFKGVQGTMAGNDIWRIGGAGTATDVGYMELATADNGNEPIYVRQYNGGSFNTLVRTATLLDGSGNTSFPGTVTASTFSGDLNGNANTSTKLATAITIGLSGDVTGTATSFDGTSNITIATTVADDSHNHIISNIDNLQTTLDSKAPSGYGLGGIANRLASGTDMNTVKANGWYDIPNAVNGPFTANWINLLVCSSGDPNYVTQIAFGMTSNVGHTYTRTMNGGTWSAWTELMNTLNIQNYSGTFVVNNTLPEIPARNPNSLYFKVTG